MPAYTIFVEPATKGGARPTAVEDIAKEYSSEGTSWRKFPHGLSPVTGKLDTSATALVFDMLATSVWQFRCAPLPAGYVERYSREAIWRFKGRWMRSRVLTGKL